MEKRLVILGSTGSIGTQTLQIADANKDIEIVGLAAGRNVPLMEQQIRKYKPKYAVMYEESAAEELKAKTADLPVTVLSGMDGLISLAEIEEYDILVTAIVGMIGIRPTIAAIKNHKTIALANKETLVTAGHLIMPMSKELSVPILPVDSEHSAIFQSLQGMPKDRIEKILLTASGGPFRGRKKKEMVSVTVEDALKHPNWSMGKKITVDSATLVNKGLEVIEAKWLFGVEQDQIEVLIHPQSILHSAVQYKDGGIMGQMGVPDMKLPIQYAIFYPDRREMDTPRVDFFALKSMTFEKPDEKTFKGLPLARKALSVGGSMPTVFNAANEKAVALFLNHKIRFLDIYDIIEASMENHKVIDNPSVDEILGAEAECYEFIQSLFGDR
ncbi:MAG: 1-deoxy-D-xylulose-5-phosphate reductoisomerase [Lachnospiraceae bacterium]|nr:1-deoxy-D-xylulose-5-phosphate reductoisomerase [Lachnospiraceae bacterium]